jgi:Protein of unknown function (DUF3352)
VTSPLRRLTLGLTALLALLVAGCGGSTSSGPASGATLVRSDLVAFVTIDSDLGSSQLKQVDALSKKFPGRAMALGKIQQSLAKKQIDFDKDVKPALGPEFDLAFVAGRTPKDTAVVGLTKPHDAGKFKDLVKKLNASDSSGNDAVYREVDGWYFISDSQAHLSRALKSGGTALSDESTYKDALGKLPSDALAKAYVNGPQLARLMKQAPKDSGFAQSGAALTAFEKLDFISASLTAESDGIRAHGALQGSGAGSLMGEGDYRSKLIDQVPADAFAFLTFRTGKALGTALSGMSGQLQYALGISADELGALFAKESAFYVRPSAVIPEFTLILQPTSTAAGLATLDKLARRIARASGARVTGGAEKAINFGQFAVHYGAKGGKLVVTSAATGIGGVGTSGDELTSSADFKEAKAAAGLPDSNGGFIYVDLKDAIPLIEGFAALAAGQVPSQVTDNLRPLRSFLSWSAGSGSSRTFDLFLEIK